MIGKRKLDSFFLKKQIEVLISFDIEQKDGMLKKVLHWCGGVVARICDGTWLRDGAQTRCYEANKAAYILWDSIPDMKIAAWEGNQELLENEWNKDCEGVWKRDLGDETFGLS